MSESKQLSAQQFVLKLEHGALCLTVPSRLTEKDHRRIKCLVELVLMDPCAPSASEQAALEAAEALEKQNG